MRFEEAYAGWQAGHLRQEEAARLLGVCERTLRRYIDRYEENGLDGLIDRRLQQLSHRRAPVDEVLALTHRYRQRHAGWSAKHYFAWYRRDGGTRSYTWVKRRLQEAQLIPRAPVAARARRPRAPPFLDPPGYARHRPEATLLYQLVKQHYPAGLNFLVCYSAPETVSIEGAGVGGTLNFIGPNWHRLG